MYNSGIGTPYWFEWEIGILECLNMLQDTSIESVILQSTDFQALDDVVVNYSDKSILNIQVKHTDEDANFTYSFLASGKKPLLNELALEWKNNKDNYNFKGIQIVTNKKWGPQETDGKCSMDDFISKVFPCLQDNYNYTSAKPNEQKAIEWYRENLEINLDSNEAACFTKIFSFRKESCLADVEEKIRVKIGEILGTDNSDAIDFCLNSLLSKLNIWATSRREKQEITRENVYGALCYTEPDVPSYELCPEKPILPSRQRFGETFIDDIKKNSNHIIFLEGLPGCGKTNFISYLSQMNESIVDFRFYTYLPVNKVDGSYSDDEGFYLGNILWRSILVQLKKKFEENNLLSVVKFPLIYQFMSVSEMRETVIHFLPEYAKCIGRPCYFFIDGLDHAARSKDARNSFLSQLPRPEEIGDDFYFVLVGQPINDGYPSWMKDNKGITYYSMPALDTDDVVILLEQSGVAENTVDMENLAKTVISVIGNNVLNIIFAILELKKMVLPLSFEAIEKELNSRFLNKQIDKYYEWIISSQEKSLLLYKIEAIMAFSSKRINAYDVAQMCGVEHDEAAFVLNGLYPIIVCEGDRYFAFHNDVRLFLQNAIIHNSNIKGITESIINRIKQDYKYEDLRIISLIKANLCLFGRIEESLVEKCYKEILNLTHNGESQRGYKPALAQYDIAKHVSEQFYSVDRNDVLSKDDIFSLIYFADKYGAGSAHDCNGYTVMRFLRKVLVSFSEHNPKAGIIDTICKAVVQCLEWDKTRFIPEFNRLFCISNAHADFLKVAEYWCGEDGVAWRSEYDEMEDLCKNMIPALEYFGENKFIEEVREKQKYRMFGYVGRKDYSLNGLLDCYKKLPLNEEKLCCYGMRLFYVSNLADSIGDNRFSSEVDRELLEDAVKLGYKYCNALFELKNTPKDLVYWRMKVLDSLYCNIDLISDDSELIAYDKLPYLAPPFDVACNSGKSLGRAHEPRRGYHRPIYRVVSKCALRE